MRILIATSDVPFVEGGHRVIARALVQALKQAGHSAEMITTPQNRFGRQFAAYTATRFTDVERTGNGDRIEKLISLRFPSYVLKHPDHVCWLNHRMREYYDLWANWYPKLSWKGKIKERVRRSLIHKADHYFLTGNLRKLFAQSKYIQQGLITWGNIPSEVLYPPPPDRKYWTDSYDDFILSPSRLTPLKRVRLLIDALSRSTRGNVVILGDGPDRGAIREKVQEYKLENRVKLVGFANEDELTRLYATCRAVYYAPAHEDYGLVTLEAFHSRKPVITAIDSGGPTELVINNESGIVINPDPDSLASAIQHLMDDPSAAERMGNNGYASAKDITWERTVSRLLM